MARIDCAVYDRYGGSGVNLQFKPGQTFAEFMSLNLDMFHKEMMLQSTKGLEYLQNRDTNMAAVYDVIDELLDLLLQAKIDDLVLLGERIGYNIAKNGHPIPLIMEFTEGFRKCLWDFQYVYHQHVEVDVEDIFAFQRDLAHGLDRFLNHYFISYTRYNEEKMNAQREIIEDLSVPVIPLTETRSILPLVGMIDTHRAKTIQEKTLTQIANLKIEHIIIDVSGVPYMDTAVVGHLFHIIEGINLLGCRATITGIRPGIANTLISLGIDISDKVETKSTLQQVLKQYMI
jgi:rsbT co-antagonist protein RsbR